MTKSALSDADHCEASGFCSSQLFSWSFCDLAPSASSRRGRKRPHQLLRPCSSQLFNWSAKRARTPRIITPVRSDLVSPPRRDWSDLDDGPAGLIAERVLAYDVADYLRFRTVCRAWRQCCTEPRSHSGLDRRFHPWRWVLLREPLAAPNRRSFLNSFTGECIQLDNPELLDHELLGVTPEGLLVLLHDHNHILLLNPLTRHFIKLPPLTTLLPFEDHVMLSYFDIYYFLATGSGIASDDSTVVLCFNMLSMLGMAKPGDDNWMLLKYNHDGFTKTPLMFAGRFYLVNAHGVMVLQIGPNQKPRLQVVAKLNMHVLPISQNIQLVNNCGQLMLLHRLIVPLTSRNNWGYRYNMYRVNLDKGTLFRVKSLGSGGAGRAMFLGMHCSFSVSLEVFPSDSISVNTIYLSFDFDERRSLKVGAYHLPYGRIERPCRLVLGPRTLVDYIAMSNTVDRRVVYPINFL
ncbi:hypothetical protein VPH35_046966 [Triticum aestivum]